MKKLLMLALIAAMSLPLAACGENTPSENNNTESIVQSSSAPETSPSSAQPNEEPEPAPESTPEPVTASTIKAALQGKWFLSSATGGSSGSFAFNSGSVTVTSQGNVLSGTYTINTSTNQVEAEFTVNNGTATITMPYTYENGVLTLYNNAGEALSK